MLLLKALSRLHGFADSPMGRRMGSRLLGGCLLLVSGRMERRGSIGIGVVIRRRLHCRLCPLGRRKDNSFLLSVFRLLACSNQQDDERDDYERRDDYVHGESHHDDIVCGVSLAQSVCGGCRGECQRCGSDEHGKHGECAVLEFHCYPASLLGRMPVYGLGVSITEKLIINNFLFAVVKEGILLLHNIDLLAF